MKHTYEVYMKYPAGEVLLCRTNKLRTAQEMYRGSPCPRLRIDGSEQPIIAANHLMKGYGKDIIVPRYQAPKRRDIHYLKPAE